MLEILVFIRHGGPILDRLLILAKTLGFSRYSRPTPNGEMRVAGEILPSHRPDKLLISVTLHLVKDHHLPIDDSIGLSLPAGLVGHEHLLGLLGWTDQYQSLNSQPQVLLFLRLVRERLLS